METIRSCMRRTQQAAATELKFLAIVTTFESGQAIVALISVETARSWWCERSTASRSCARSGDSGDDSIQARAASGGRELLGLGENHGPATVTGCNGSTGADRVARSRARQMASGDRQLLRLPLSEGGTKCWSRDRPILREGKMNLPAKPITGLCGGVPCRGAAWHPIPRVRNNAVATNGLEKA